MKALRKPLALLISFLFPLSSFLSQTPKAFAAPRSVWDGSVDVSWFEAAKTEFYIDTPAQLAGLAALVNGMVDPSCKKVIGDAGQIKSVAIANAPLVGAGGGSVNDTVYGSKIDFAYKTVYLNADMDMGGVRTGDKWSGPNWTPIGGKYPMKPDEAKGDCLTLDTRFNGVLDGMGHTVSNIFCDRYAAKGFPYSMAAGIVGFLGGERDDTNKVVAKFENGWQPAVRNIIVGNGYIYARRMVGGVVGRIGLTSNGVIVENCANFADIRNTDSKGIGGIVGSGWGAGVIRNCYNSGSVATTYACPAGGICGSNIGMNIYNCYNVGKIDSKGQARGRGIGSHDSGAYTVANCFYLEGCDDDPASGGWYTGNSRNIAIDVKQKTSAEMKATAFIDMLNASGEVFVADNANINNGYPILYYQTQGNGKTASYSVTVEQPAAGGTVSADLAGAVAAGHTVTLAAQASAGWVLKHFTLNGKALEADFFTVSADCVAGAVFSQVRQVKVALPASEDSYMSFSKTGYELSDGKMIYVNNKPLSSGDAVLEQNIIKVFTFPYENSAPSDKNLEYTDKYTITASNAEKNADGIFIVTGAGDISFTAARNTSKKSWLSLADSRWYTGEHDTYTLGTAEQLAGMAVLVNVEGVDFKGVTIRLGRDISLRNSDGTAGGRIWEACGKNASRSFSGTFDGGGYCVYNMAAYNTGSYAGLFGYCVDAEIRNLTVRGTVDCEASTAYAAGIVSYASGCKIENCVNRAAITATGTGAAGIAAYICDGTTVADCANRGSVSGTSGVGGVVGICYSAEDVIMRCCNYAEVSASGDNSYGVGGIAGQLAGSLAGCANYAAVASADRYTGGLAGYTTSRTSSKMSDSVSAGSVLSSCPNQSAAVGIAVGYAQYLSMENVTATGAVSVGSGFRSPYKGGAIGREGTVAPTGGGASAGGGVSAGSGATTGGGNAPPLTAAADSDNWTHPPEKQAPWTITFVADGKVVGAPTYSGADEAITEPAIPEKPGHTSQWADYALGSQDLTVRAVYRPIIARSGDVISKNGTYFLDPSTSGELTIADNIAVTLDGAIGDCTGMSISTGKSTNLTLNNIHLNGNTTLLTINGGSAVTIKGDNALTGMSDVRENATPTVSVSGGVSIQGTGNLYVSADAGNSAIKLEPGAALELISGVLTVFKKGMLGIDGGALYANEATVKISGGVFSGCTDSDNVSVISAQALTISGGTVRAQSEKSPFAIAGDTVTISGGALYCAGHTGNSSSVVKSYADGQAISGIVGKPACRFEKALPFADVRVTDAYFDSVRLAYNAGYFTGVSATEFAPGKPMTRAMFVTVLYRMWSSRSEINQHTKPDSPHFNDIVAGSWYYDAVSWAVANGITTGTSATTFSPNANVTTEQLAVFLSRYAKSIGKAAAPQNGDNGAGASPWARSSVAWAVENGMLPTGCNFQANATRATLAAAVMAIGS